MQLRNYIKEETLAIHRDRGTNGNEIGENITAIKRKSRNGIYISGTSDKQGIIKRMSPGYGWGQGCWNRRDYQRGIREKSGRKHKRSYRTSKEEVL